jgi:outer membrane protein
VKLHSILCVLALPLAAQQPPKPQQSANRAAAETAGAAAAPTKIGILQFQQAVLSTQEGQQASAALQTKYNPKKTQLDKKKADLESMQDRLQKGGATMSNDARAKLQSDINNGGRDLNREVEDLNSEVDQEQAKIGQTIAEKMGVIIQNYAKQNGYAIVLDVSAEAQPVLWATPAVNISADIVKLYDQAHPVKGAMPAVPAAAPKTPPPASKKQ